MKRRGRDGLNIHTGGEQGRKMVDAVSIQLLAH